MRKAISEVLHLPLPYLCHNLSQAMTVLIDQMYRCSNKQNIYKTHEKLFTNTLVRSDTGSSLKE